jgi:putative phosphoesterase
VTHGHMGENREALKNAMAAFKDDNMDVVIFGHSHHALNERLGTTLYFNPGSPNDVVKAKYFSYGLIRIEGGKIKAEIIRI